MDKSGAVPSLADVINSLFCKVHQQIGIGVALARGADNLLEGRDQASQAIFLLHDPGICLDVPGGRYNLHKLRQINLRILIGREDFFAAHLLKNRDKVD